MKKDGSPWQKIAELRLPADSPFKYIYSCEPIAPETGVNGTSYFSLNATKNAGQQPGRNRTHREGWLDLGASASAMTRPTASSAAWMKGLSAASRPRRYESESFVGTDEVFIYYERKSPETGRGELRRCRTGISTSGKPPAASKPQSKEEP